MFQPKAGAQNKMFLLNFFVVNGVVELHNPITLKVKPFIFGYKQLLHIVS